MDVRTRRRGFAALALVVASAVGATGCAVRGSGFQYVRSPKTGTYLKLPSSWSVRVVSGKDVDFWREFNHPSGEVKSVADLFATHEPAGFVRVVTLDPAEKDAVSLAAARNLVFNIDQGVTSGSLQLVDGVPFELHQNGFRGQHVVFTTTADLGNMTIDQTTFLDAGGRHMYHLVIGCLSDCYARNKKDIKTVTTSFTLREP